MLYKTMYVSECACVCVCVCVCVRASTGVLRKCGRMGLGYVYHVFEL